MDKYYKGGKWHSAESWNRGKPQSNDTLKLERRTMKFLIFKGEKHLLAMCLDHDFVVQGRQNETNDLDDLRNCIHGMITAHKQICVEEGIEFMSNLGKVPDSIKVQVNKIIDIWEIDENG